MDNKSIIIAIAGTSRAGKDTFADVLAQTMEELGLGTPTRIAFADPIKELYNKFFYYVDTESKPRDAYVTIGNAFRSIDSEVWIRPVYKRLLEELSNNNSVIVTDVRYQNEAEALREAGIPIVKVVADDWVRQERSHNLGEELDLNNEGDREVGFIKEDITIINNGEEDFKTLPLMANLAIQEAYRILAEGD